MEMEVSSGFLVVKTFARMYREYLDIFKRWWQKEHPNDEPVLVEQMTGKYRGICRDPMQPWTEKFRDTGVVEPTEQELKASIFMWELADLKKEEDDFIFDLEDAKKMIAKIPPPIEREIIWARRIDKNEKPPSQTDLLGYEPTAFYPDDHGSILANYAFFAFCRTEKEKHLTKQLDKFHSKLNKWGLFDSAIEAQKYKDFILEIAPEEHEGINYIAEIRSAREV